MEGRWREGGIEGGRDGGMKGGREREGEGGRERWMKEEGREGEKLASFPGLHAQLLSLAVRKAGEGLDGFIT